MLHSMESQHFKWNLLKVLKIRSSAICKCGSHSLTSVIINKILKTLQNHPKFGVLVHFQNNTSINISNRKMLTGDCKKPQRWVQTDILHINIGKGQNVKNNLEMTADQCHRVKCHFWHNDVSKRRTSGSMI